MDLMSVLGWLLGIAVLLFGIMVDTSNGIRVVFENLKSFWDLPSLLIVVCGVNVALMISYPGRYFKKIPKHLKIVLFPTKYNPQEYIAQIVELAKEARVNGLLSLESKLAETSDAFLRNSMMMVVDAVEPEKVKALLAAELDYLDERHAQDRAFYDKAAGYAPAYGMVGTLMGLINLMKNLSDPDAIAPAMALALVTTFYGTLLANMFFAPISNKLKVRHEEEYLCKMIIVEGVESIQAGDNPKFIEEKLTQLLPSYLAGALGADEGDKKSKKAKK